MKKVLYLSYDGMTDPLGQSQVIPYLQGLAKAGYQFTIISFEKEDRFQKHGEYIRSLLDATGIKWNPKLFSRRPPILSKIYDNWQMKRLALKLQEKEKYSFIHCRSYVAAGVGQILSARHGIPFLFDMRGFWVDERVDSGQWSLANPLYRFFYNYYKKKEKGYLKDSAHIISLTWKGKDELVNNYGIAGDKITVIPCCVDLDHFNYALMNKSMIDEKKRSLNIHDDNKVISYLGSLGGWYLVNEMLEFFREMKKKIAAVKFLFITHDSSASVMHAARALNISPDDIIVRSASRNEVPLYLSLSNWSIFFIKDAYSKKASSPTKQGEIMAMGIPVICNDVGDTGKIIEASGSGFVVNEFSTSEYERIAGKIEFLDHLNKEDLRKSAFDYFDLQKGVEAYSSVYKKLGK